MHQIWLTTYLSSCLMDVFFNRQSSIIWMPIVLFFYSTCSTRSHFMQRFLTKYEKKLVHDSLVLRSTMNLDEVISLNNSMLSDYADRILSIDLEINGTTDTTRSVPYIHRKIDKECLLRTKPYDRTYYFNFPIVNFLFIRSNIPAAPACRVYISLGWSEIPELVPMTHIAMAHIWLTICFICPSRNPVLSFFMTFMGFLKRVTRRVPLAEHELRTLHDHLSSPSVFNGVHVAQSFVFYVLLCRLLHVCTVRLYLQLFVEGYMSCLLYLCLFAYSGVQHILCCVFVLFFFVLCTLCCQFLRIIHFFYCPFGIL